MLLMNNKDGIKTFVLVVVGQAPPPGGPPPLPPPPAKSGLDPMMLMLLMNNKDGDNMMPLMLMMNNNCKESEGSSCVEKKSGDICGKDLSAAEEAILAAKEAFGAGFKLKPCCKCK